MKRIALLILLLFACRVFAPSPSPAPSPSATAYRPTAAPELTDTPAPTDTSAPTLLASPPSGLTRDNFVLRTHPDGSLHVGDRVSLELVALEPASLDGEPVEIAVVEESGALDLQSQFGQYGIGGRMQATLTWAWSTLGLEPGEYNLNISIPSQNLSWQQDITLLPADQLPAPEPQAAWTTSETDCCLVHHITGTEADRDLDELLSTVDERAANAVRLMGIELDEPIEINFLPRVLGHGGFAGQEISVSYLDRNYASDNSDVVLHHEIIHALDSRLGGDFRPTLFSEGLAVYLTGGHFKPEPLTPRAAALLSPAPGCAVARDVLAVQAHAPAQPVCGLDWYLPLIPLMDNFYLSQHEVGYLQAASLIEFMVNTWGWEAFDAFYRDIHPAAEPTVEGSATPGLSSETPEMEAPGQELGPQAAAVNNALVEHFGITIEQLEEQHMAALAKVDLQPELAEDVRLSVGFFDTVRRYQRLLDPSAYFLTAWLPDAKMMREQGLVADYLRRPGTAENIALEVMLVAADAGLQAGDITVVERLLQSVNAVLESLETGDAQSAWTDALAADYLAVVSLLLEAGYLPQQVDLQDGSARAHVRTTGPELHTVDLEKQPAGWAIRESTQTPAPP